MHHHLRGPGQPLKLELPLRDVPIAQAAALPADGRDLPEPEATGAVHSDQVDGLPNIVRVREDASHRLMALRAERRTDAEDVRSSAMDREAIAFPDVDGGLLRGR